MRVWAQLTLSFFTQPSSHTQGMVPPTFSLGLPTPVSITQPVPQQTRPQVNLSQTIPHWEFFPRWLEIPSSRQFKTNRPTLPWHQGADSSTNLWNREDIDAQRAHSETRISEKAEAHAGWSTLCSDEVKKEELGNYQLQTSVACANCTAKKQG